MATSKRKVVIDCDPGNDDAMAILMALNDPDVDVIAVTCVEGNTNVKQTGLNALRTLQVGNRLDIPVHIGCDSPLLGNRERSSHHYHGYDGLGDVPDAHAPGEDMLQTEHGVQALLRLSKENEGQLDLVAVGPLTNVAMAIRMDRKFGSRLRSCTIMGGNYLCQGNVSVSGEFNFYADAAAAYVTLNQLGCPITVLPWETCMDHGIPLETHERMRSVDSPKARFMKAVDTLSLKYVKSLNRKTFVPADEAAMACYLRSDVIEKCVHLYASVETKGEYTSGQMVVDWKGKLGMSPNVTIVTNMYQDLYEELMTKALL